MICLHWAALIGRFHGSFAFSTELPCAMTIYVQNSVKKHHLNNSYPWKVVLYLDSSACSLFYLHEIKIPHWTESKNIKVLCWSFSVYLSLVQSVAFINQVLCQTYDFIVKSNVLWILAKNGAEVKIQKYQYNILEHRIYWEANKVMIDLCDLYNRHVKICSCKLYRLRGSHIVQNISIEQRMPVIQLSGTP